MRAESGYIEWGVRWPFVPIPGMSERALSDIRFAEIRGKPWLWEGITVAALRQYRKLLRRPGRIPFPDRTFCLCPICTIDGARSARQVLDEVLSQLPPRADRVEAASSRC
ncbi:hypothetical protein ACQP0C_31030 [Nocardia sp. CA-129566]|uniref:hypothetical protein n=1 Tax=Nocardia sp. CA-129566 TaxID=3239976 RepID=UPI003D991258